MFHCRCSDGIREVTPGIGAVKRPLATINRLGRILTSVPIITVCILPYTSYPLATVTCSQVAFLFSLQPSFEVSFA
jgi:hypothetical protein